MDQFASQKVKDLLNNVHGLQIYKIHGAYMEFDKSYMTFIYFKTDAELRALSEETKNKIKTVYFDYFKERGYMPNEIETITFYFDSDENVQKNYAGNYFYATR